MNFNFFLFPAPKLEWTQKEFLRELIWIPTPCQNIDIQKFNKILDPENFIKSSIYTTYTDENMSTARSINAKFKKNNTLDIFDTMETNFSDY